MSKTSEDVQKELLEKIALLRQALINEKKTSELEQNAKALKKINADFEIEIENKDSEILKLTNDKQKLVSQIDFHRSKSFINTGILLPNFDHAGYEVDIKELEEVTKKKKNEEKEIFNNDDEDQPISPIAEIKEEYKDKMQDQSQNQFVPNVILNSSYNLSQNLAVKILNEKEEDPVEVIKNTVSSIFYNFFEKDNVIDNKENKDNKRVTINTTNNTLKDINTNDDIKSPRRSSSIYERMNTDSKTSYQKLDEISMSEFDNKSTKKEVHKFNNMIQNLELIIHQLKDENVKLKASVTEGDKNINKVKEEYKSMLNSQVIKIKILEEENRQLKEEIISHELRTKSIVDQNKSFEIKVINGDCKIRHLEGELVICKESLEKLSEKISEKTLIVCQLQENLNKAETENSNLSMKLNELKKAVMSENIRMQIFSGKKKELLSRNPFTLTFDKNEYGVFMVYYNENDSKVNENIPVEFVDSIKIIDENDNLVELSFIKSGKQFTFSLIMNENINQLIRVFKDFKDRALKQKALLS